MDVSYIKRCCLQVSSGGIIKSGMKEMAVGMFGNGGNYEGSENNRNCNDGIVDGKPACLR